MAKKTTVKRAGRDSDQFMVRLPDGMRKQLAEVAERNGRSMNAEVVAALVVYFENQGAASKESQIVATALKDLRDRLATLDQKVTESIRNADTSELVQLLKKMT